VRGAGKGKKKPRRVLENRVTEAASKKGKKTKVYISPTCTGGIRGRGMKQRASATREKSDPKEGRKRSATERKNKCPGPPRVRGKTKGQGGHSYRKKKLTSPPPRQEKKADDRMG